MRGSAGVMALVLGETVAGAAALVFLTPLWGEVKRGFFKLTGSILLALAAATWLATRAGALAGDEAGRWATRIALALATVTLVWLALLFVRKDLAARVVGIAALPVAIALLAAFSLTARQSWPLALFQLLAGAVFLGGVLAGLLLGHWYLTDRGLSRTPINRFTDLLIAAVFVETAAVLSGGFGAIGETAEFNPLLTAGALAPWIALGMVVTTGIIAVMVHVTLRGTRASAVQAATGFFYLAVVTAFTAEVAAKVRFLPR